MENEVDARQGGVHRWSHNAVRVGNETD
jgi:hypothetical protein